MICSERIIQIFHSFTNKKVLVIGDVMIDEYLRGNVTRLSPEAPVPVVEIDSESYHFGGAANVALNLKTLGCEPIIVGMVGHDRMGEIFIDLLRQELLSADGIIQTDDRPTTVKTRIIGGNQHLARVDREKIKYVSDHLLTKVMETIEQFLTEIDGIILEDYNKGVLSREVINRTLAAAGERSILSAVDPKFINFLEYKKATVFKPNIKEAAQALARPIETDEDVYLAGRELIEKLSVECVLITRGAKGLSLFEKNGEITQVPTKSRKVADVSGAGDTVISTVTAALIGGASFKEAAIFANYAAGVVCEEVGIVPIKRDDLKRVLLNGRL